MTFPKLSQTTPGPNGYNDFTGDRFDPSLDFNETSTAIKKALQAQYPDLTFRVLRRVYAGGRTLRVLISAAEADLSDNDIAQKLKTSISDIAARYGFDRSNKISEHSSVHFIISVEIAPEYWLARLKRTLSETAALAKPEFPLDEMLAIGTAIHETGGTHRVGRTYKVRETADSGFTTDDGIGQGGSITWAWPTNNMLFAAGSKIYWLTATAADPTAHRIFTIEQPKSA